MTNIAQAPHFVPHFSYCLCSPPSRRVTTLHGLVSSVFELHRIIIIFFFGLLSFVVVVAAISWAAPVAYGGSQARG